MEKLSAYFFGEENLVCPKSLANQLIIAQCQEWKAIVGVAINLLRESDDIICHWKVQTSIFQFVIHNYYLMTRKEYYDFSSQ